MGWVIVNSSRSTQDKVLRVTDMSLQAESQLKPGCTAKQTFSEAYFCLSPHPHMYVKDFLTCKE